MTVHTARPIGAQHPRVRDLLLIRKDGSPGRIMVEGSWEHDRLLATTTPIDTFFWCPEAGTPDAAQRIADRATEGYRISEKLLARLSRKTRTEGLISIARLPEWTPQTFRLTPEPLILVADGVEYAGNLGTLIRTVDAAKATASPSPAVAPGRRIRPCTRRAAGPCCRRRSWSSTTSLLLRPGCAVTASASTSPIPQRRAATACRRTTDRLRSSLVRRARGCRRSGTSRASTRCRSRCSARRTRSMSRCRPGSCCSRRGLGRRAGEPLAEWQRHRRQGVCRAVRARRGRRPVRSAHRPGRAVG